MSGGNGGRTVRGGLYRRATTHRTGGAIYATHTITGHHHRQPRAVLLARGHGDCRSSLPDYEHRPDQAERPHQAQGQRGQGWSHRRSRVRGKRRTSGQRRFPGQRRERRHPWPKRRLAGRKRRRRWKHGSTVGLPVPAGSYLVVANTVASGGAAEVACGVTGGSKKDNAYGQTSATVNQLTLTDVETTVLSSPGKIEVSCGGTPEHFWYATLTATQVGTVH